MTMLGLTVISIVLGRSWLNLVYKDRGSFICGNSSNDFVTIESKCYP